MLVILLFLVGALIAVKIIAMVLAVSGFIILLICGLIFEKLKVLI